MFIGTDVPANSYTVAQTEWVAAKSTYTLYVSQNANNDRFIPILIVLQEEVNHVTMLETIEHCSMVYENFRLLPTVLIISIKGCFSLEDDEEFSAVDDSFSVQCKSSFWVHKYFLFFPDSVSIDTVNTPYLLHYVSTYLIQTKRFFFRTI